MKKKAKFPLIGKIVLLVLVAYAAFTLISLRSQIADAKAELADKEATASSLEQENQRMEGKMAALGTDEGVEDVARSSLGLVNAGEIVFRDVGSQSKSD